MQLVEYYPMTAEQFKEIRDYLTANRFKGQKWSQESIGRALLSTKVTVNRWENGQNSIPELVAERMHEMMAECGLEQVERELKARLSKVHTPREISELIKKISTL